MFYIDKDHKDFEEKVIDTIESIALSLFLFSIIGFFLFLAWYFTNGRIDIENYKPGFGSRVVYVGPIDHQQREIVFMNGKHTKVNKAEDITIMVKPNEVVLRAENGSYQLREDYLLDVKEGQQQ